MAPLPLLNQRIIAIKAAAKIASNAQESLKEIMHGLAAIRDHNGATDVVPVCQEVLFSWDGAFAQSTDLNELIVDVIDADVEEVVSALVALHMDVRRELLPAIRLLRRVVAGREWPSAREYTLAVSNLFTARNLLNRSEEACHAKLQEASSIIISLSGLYQAAKHARTNLLRLG